MAQNLELVEKLVEKTGLSYGEAKAALERNDWDMLEAIIQLEQQGKVQGAKTAQYSTNSEAEANKQEESGKDSCGRHHQNRQHRETCSQTGENFKRSAKSFGECLKDIFEKGNKNSIQMYRKDVKMIELPITAFVVLLIFCFWVILPLMIVSLFFGCRYSFIGNELGRDSVNSAMGKASDIADNIKNEFKAENKGN